jgi:hypothetical protein
MRQSWLALVFLAAACGGQPPSQTSAPESAAQYAPAVPQVSIEERIARSAALLTTGNEADTTKALAELQLILIEHRTGRTFLTISVSHITS